MLIDGKLLTFYDFKRKMGYECEDEFDFKEVSTLLDKTIIRQLHLLEEKMVCELNIESSINTGTIHLAKSRYIMGRSSVSGSRLPTESSPQFSASVLCDTVEEDGIKQFQVVDNDSGNTVNPLHWFGVLVPQDLYKAKSIFQNTINFVVECANIQKQIVDNINNYQMLCEFKKLLLNKDTY